MRNPAPPPTRIFLLSPARCDGVRMMMLRRKAAQFALALELRSEMGATLGDVFTFTSGLYFRGKLTYARSFGPSRLPAARISPATGSCTWSLTCGKGQAARAVAPDQSWCT